MNWATFLPELFSIIGTLATDIEKSIHKNLGNGPAAGVNPVPAPQVPSAAPQSGVTQTFINSGMLIPPHLQGTPPKK